MKKITLSVCCLFLFFQSFTQTDSLQKQINEQVWKPFIQSFNNDDKEVFKSVHSKDVIRVIQDDNTILSYDEYFREIPDSIKLKWNSWKKSIELHFIQRIANSNKAFEVGYYKTTNTNISSGEKRVGYGKFHVLLQKENGTWKILMDADAGENTNEAFFLSGTSIK
jgi:hypothetical protein